MHNSFPFCALQIPKNTGQSIKSATESFQAELEGQQQHDEVKTDGIFTVRISSGAAVGTASCGDLKPDKDEIQDDRFWPQPRMSSCLAIKHGVLYLYGGIFETGKWAFARTYTIATKISRKE